MPRKKQAQEPKAAPASKAKKAEPKVALVKMAKEGRPKTADIHPAEVENMKRYGWFIVEEPNK